MTDRPKEMTRPLIDGGLTITGPKPAKPAVKEQDDE